MYCKNNTKPAAVLNLYSIKVPLLQDITSYRADKQKKNLISGPADKIESVIYIANGDGFLFGIIKFENEVLEKDLLDNSYWEPIALKFFIPNTESDEKDLSINV